MLQIIVHILAKRVCDERNNKYLNSLYNSGSFAQSVQAVFRLCILRASLNLKWSLTRWNLYLINRAACYSSVYQTWSWRETWGPQDRGDHLQNSTFLGKVSEVLRHRISEDSTLLESDDLSQWLFYIFNLPYISVNTTYKFEFTATCFDLTSHLQAYLWTLTSYNLPVRIWDPRWLTMCVCI